MDTGPPGSEGANSWNIPDLGLFLFSCKCVRPIKQESTKEPPAYPCGLELRGASMAYHGAWLNGPSKRTAQHATSMDGEMEKANLRTDP